MLLWDFWSFSMCFRIWTQSFCFFFSLCFPGAYCISFKNKKIYFIIFYFNCILFYILFSSSHREKNNFYFFKRNKREPNLHKNTKKKDKNKKEHILKLHFREVIWQYILRQHFCYQKFTSSLPPHKCTVWKAMTYIYPMRIWEWIFSHYTML